MNGTTNEKTCSLLEQHAKRASGELLKNYFEEEICYFIADKPQHILVYNIGVNGINTEYRLQNVAAEKGY